MEASVGFLILGGLLLVGAVLAGARAFAKGYGESFGSETGKRDAERLEAWRVRRAQRARKGGVTGPSLLALMRGEVASDGGEALLPQGQPPRSGPAPDEHVYWLAVGRGLQSGQADLAQLEVEQGGAQFVRVPAASSPFPFDGGAFVSDVEEAIAEGAARVRSGEASLLGVALTLPLSGSWTTEPALDMGRLFRAIFEPRDCPIWLTYSEPIDISAWPAQVKLLTPLAGRNLVPFLKAAGAFVEADKSVSVHGKAITLSSASAARSLLALAWSAEHGSLPPAATTFPPYSSYIALALADSPAASVTRSTSTARDLQLFMQEEGVRVLASPSSGVGRVLPLTPYRGVVTAWRLADSAPDEQIPLQAPFVTRGAPPPDGVDLLTRALDDGDSLLATAVLARHGRAWLETADASDYVGRLRHVEERFPWDSAPSLWAHFLQALDASLRLGDPAERWFSEDECRAAGRYGLESLFRAARMEFARLRGDRAAALQMLSALYPTLAADIPASDAATTYAEATARFVLANSLRQGGRYDLARESISRAQLALDPSVPAHAIELLHCRYALSVCDAIAEIPRIEPVLDTPAGQQLFGRALVVLGNAQASWFVGDLTRAQDYASKAKAAFREIGYRRYEMRAGRVVALLRLWEDLTAGEGAPSWPDDALGSAIGEIVNREREQIDLSGMRPSAALSVLQFGVAFEPEPVCGRTVHIPGVLEDGGEAELSMSAPIAVEGVDAANALLRELMGVGLKHRVPLIPD